MDERTTKNLLIPERDEKVFSRGTTLVDRKFYPLKSIHNVNDTPRLTIH
jgi:hypothetical protein